MLRLTANCGVSGMLYLLGGFAILCGLLLLGYLFVNTEPARLARSLKVDRHRHRARGRRDLAISGRLACS